jgi:hypothetical protein
MKPGTRGVQNNSLVELNFGRYASNQDIIPLFFVVDRPTQRKASTKNWLLTAPWCWSALLATDCPCTYLSTTPWRRIGGVGVYLHAFLTSALDGGEWLASRPGRFTRSVKASSVHWIRGWVGPRAGLDVVEERKISIVIAPAGNWTPVVQSVV